LRKSHSLKTVDGTLEETIRIFKDVRMRVLYIIIIFLGGKRQAEKRRLGQKADLQKAEQLTIILF
jgi:hypothetical protein